MISLKLNKKGTLADIPYVMALLFLMAITIFIGTHVWAGFFAVPLTQQGQAEAAPVAEVKASFDQGVVNNFDYWTLTLLFAALIIMVALAYMVRNSPAFVPLSIVFVMLVVFISHFISEAGVMYMDNPGFAAEKERFPITYYIIDNLEVVLLIMSSMVMIATYGLNPGEGFA